MKILVDIASIAKRALLAGKDKENGYYQFDPDLNKEVLVNTAQYGYDNLCNSMVTTMKSLNLNPKDMIFVYDGANSTKFRESLYSGYKAGRTKNAGFYTEYNKMMNMFETDWLHLGSHFARHPGVEADDLIGWLCQTIVEDNLLVWTNDNDLLVLAKYPHVKVLSNGEVNAKPYGNFPYEFIDVYKATVGDSSDKIPGAKGFGPKAFEQLYAKFGDNGLAVLRKLIETKQLAKLAEDVPALPPLQKLIDYAPDVEVSLKLATLQVSSIVQEKTDWKHGLNVGEAVHPFLAGWSQQVVGVTAKNFDSAFEDLKRLTKDTGSVSLDIETSTPYESDAYLYEITGKEGGGVDVFGSELTGLSLTVGSNWHRTFYFSVDHKGENNCTLEQVEQVLKFLDPTHRFVIQNVNFELTVLHNTFGWFLRDVDDTKLMASYVDENESTGLKQNSLRWLGYTQASYEETTQGRKMNELSLKEVLSYGTDDTICTAALLEVYQIRMMLERAWNIYRKVEIGAAYWVAQAFIDGVKIDQVALSKMIARDAADRLKYEADLNSCLISVGWEGAVYEEATQENWNTPAWIKYAFNLMTGRELKTSVRKLERLVEEVRNQGCMLLAECLELHDVESLNLLVRPYFKAAPAFNAGSPKQMQNLMYEVMELPIRIRNKPTDLMRIKGLEGSPSTDDVAISSALHFDLESDDPRRKALEALLKIKMYNTREGLYYKNYPKLPHWKDNKIHASMNQCATVTRRFSSSSPK